jgi:hypothetical protein
MIGSPECMNGPFIIGGIPDQAKVYQMPFDLRFQGVARGGHGWLQLGQKGDEKGLRSRLMRHAGRPGGCHAVASRDPLR